jgi:hypothetical protein
MDRKDRCSIQRERAASHNHRATKNEAKKKLRTLACRVSLLSHLTASAPGRATEVKWTKFSNGQPPRARNEANARAGSVT